MLIPGFHGVTFIATFAVLVGSIFNIMHSSEGNLYSATLLLVVSIILLSLAFYARLFALRAQDRAIRAEENFRHYLMTQKPLSQGLTMRQIIGLRFSSDEEFLALVERAEKENMTENDIKKAIINWRPDTYRA